MQLAFAFKAGHYAGVAAFIAALTAPSFAQIPLSLEEAVRLAAAQSRQLAAGDAAVRAATDIASSASQLPDPVVRLGVDNLPVDGPDRYSISRDFMTMRRIGLMQEFTRPEKLRLRAERGDIEVERERALRLGTLASVQRDSALAWVEVHFLERMRDELRALGDETRLAIDAAQAAYRGGRGTQGDVYAAQASLVLVEDRMADAERRIRTARTALARWIGTDAERLLDARLGFHDLKVDAASLEHRLHSHPQILALERQAAVSEVEARLARTATRPDWSVELAYQQRGPAFSNMLSFGVSVPLPIAPARRQDRQTSSRIAVVEQARALHEDALRAHAAELRATTLEWEAGRARQRRLEQTLVPLAAQRKDAALAAYRGNAGTLAALIEARRSEVAARLQVLDVAADTARAWARLSYYFPAFGAEGGAR